MIIFIVAGTHEGLAAARARGKVGGRPTVVNEDLIRAARDMLTNPANCVTTIAKILNVSVGPPFGVSRAPAGLRRRSSNGPHADAHHD